MERIAILGCGGAGKSTLARQLGDVLDLPVYHLDALHWKPGWVMPPKNERHQAEEEIVRSNRWIIDGNYCASQNIRLPAADTVIFLDFPRRVCIYQALKRWAKYRGRTRPDIGPGCPEKIDWEFVRWMWDFNRTSRPEICRNIETYASRARVVTLRSPREVRQFVESLEKRCTSSA